MTGATAPGASEDFFKDISFDSAEQTLRRAAILLAGRFPTEEEVAHASTGDPELREAIRALMTGEEFHQFLIRGANDRLLTDSFINGTFLEVIDNNNSFYPVLADRKVAAYTDGSDPVTSEFESWMNDLRYGITRAPIELIAHIVETDRPYTEILTANYTMVNPQSNLIFNSGATFTSEDPTVFKVGSNNGQILNNDELIVEYEEGIGSVIESHGAFVSYPHAGILNEPAFLNRYPTTDTNRNRARSRWTYYHFLNVDIEKSAARTTDPDALADTNNPTLNNANCTVCHKLMGPIAGTFQNFDDLGNYRVAWDGLDSLPNIYKEEEGSPYIFGDVWYRDMLSPGIVGKDMPADNNDNSLQWLAQELVSDERFAEAAVYFWWESIMSDYLLTAPEDSEDSNFDDRFLGYEAQGDLIRSLAQSFQTGFNGGAQYNLKDLLTEMIMSNWFRANGSSVALTEARQTALEGVGSGRLLTPFELEKKTAELTGFVWGEYPDEWAADNLSSRLRNQYRIYYGGIDSNGITERAKVLNSLMSNVALTQAISVSCPTVIFDFNRSDEDKTLFSFVDRYTTPYSQAQQQYSVTADSFATATTHTLNETLDAGSQRLRLSFDNPYWDSVTDTSLILIVHEVEVTNSEGEVLLAFDAKTAPSIEGSSFSLNEEGNPNGSENWYNGGSDPGWVLWTGYLEVPLEIVEAGTYNISVSASKLNHPSRPANLSISVDGTSPYGTQGATAIRTQLQFLHKKLLGEDLAIDSTEITESYELLLLLRNERIDNNYPQNAIAWDIESCAISTPGWWDASREEERNAELADPDYMQGTWASMLIYFLTDYLYLHE